MRCVRILPETAVTDDKHVIDDKHLVFDVNTVEDALDLASRQWGVPAEELRSEVIGSEKVFLGLFGKKLKVEVTLPERSLLCRGRDFVDDLLKLMDLRADTVLREEENVVDIEGQDATQIGRASCRERV